MVFPQTNSIGVTYETVSSNSCNLETTIMFQLTKEMVSQWDHLPDEACISGKEMREVTKLLPKQIGAYVRAGQLPPAACIMSKNRFQPSGSKPLWKLRVLRQWVTTDPDLRITRDLEKREKVE